MSVSVSLNGVSHTIPSTGETGWGSQVTAFLQAVGSSTLQKSGGSFTLTADADFGGTYGLKSAYFVSRTASAATAGAVRLARADRVSFRNQADGANLDLGPGSDNLLEFNSVDIVDVSTAQTLTNKTLTAPAITGAATIATGATITTPTIVASAWTNMTLVNSWVAFGGTYSTPGYRKLPDGTVELRGAVKNGSGAEVNIVTLPVGFRPAETIVFPISSNGRCVFLIVRSDGTTNAVASNTESAQTAEVVLNSVRFPTT